MVFCISSMHWLLALRSIPHVPYVQSRLPNKSPRISQIPPKPWKPPQMRTAQCEGNKRGDMLKSCLDFVAALASCRVMSMVEIPVAFVWKHSLLSTAQPFVLRPTNMHIWTLYGWDSKPVSGRAKHVPLILDAVKKQRVKITSPFFFVEPQINILFAMLMICDFP